LTDEQRRELWARWKRGETLAEIGRALERSTPNVFNTLRAGGGIGPRERRERSSALKMAEREEISRGLVSGQSFRAIARGLRRSASTVSREVAHGGGRESYRALGAQERAMRCARRPKLCLLAQRPELQALVAAKLEQKWSPQQIAGWLKRSLGCPKGGSRPHRRPRQTARYADNGGGRLVRQDRHQAKSNPQGPHPARCLRRPASGRL
jgi:DNA-binding CsgD family transcriptional regulator